MRKNGIKRDQSNIWPAFFVVKLTLNMFFPTKKLEISSHTHLTGWLPRLETFDLLVDQWTTWPDLDSSLKKYTWWYLYINIYIYISYMNTLSFTFERRRSVIVLHLWQKNPPFTFNQSPTKPYCGLLGFLAEKSRASVVVRENGSRPASVDMHIQCGCAYIYICIIYIHT